MNDLDDNVKRLQSLPSQQAVVEEAFKIVTTRYRGSRPQTLLRLWKLWPAPITSLWRSRGFLYCTNQNRLLAYLLLASGKFKDSDLKKRWTLYWGFSPHQYLQITVGSRIINADPWSHVYGIKLGDYSHWFHTKTKEL